MFCFVLTTLLGLIAPKGLDTNGTPGPMLGVFPLQLTDHNTGISLLLSTSAWVLLSPPITCRETRPTIVIVSGDVILSVREQIVASKLITHTKLLTKTTR